MRFSQAVITLTFLSHVASNFASPSEANEEAPCQKQLCDKCEESEAVCAKQAECKATGSKSPVCKRIAGEYEDAETFCETCKGMKQKCQESSSQPCEATEKHIPLFPFACGAAGAACDQYYQCCNGLKCSQNIGSKRNGRTTCCVKENQQCSGIGAKTCCQPYSCEANPSGKGFLCSATLPLLPNSNSTSSTTCSTTSTTPAPAGPAPPQAISPVAFEQEPLCTSPSTQPAPFYPNVPPSPNCYNCTQGDPVCCDGQYCDTGAGLCKQCSAGIDQPCKSRPGGGADCCTPSLSCLISKQGESSGTCQATCSGNNSNNICVTGYNCCREDPKASPTRFECRVLKNTTDGEKGEKYQCTKCAKPHECCRTNEDCCRYPIGYGCMSGICDFSKEEEPPQGSG